MTNNNKMADQGLTWEQMIEIEPRLQELYEEAKEEVIGENYCANAQWFKGMPSMKQRLLELVGWYAENSQLNSELAYDIAYQKIYDALPDCNHESFFCS